ncbi:pVlll protein [Equine adenovirus 2]|uniref:Pre-hexon-linking protein VIII n=1 Tax=Equine adenovirus B serotype 2 TaxID=67603 RepID=A0A0K1DCI0_ADEE2|nr:pVlll protein [Equine adenovirus 2]AKT26038.1 pVlll protein [Equine adenovirus 2]
MSKEIPTPYIWTLNPQMGVAAGASQDYSTKMNWLSAGANMIQRVNDIREDRNSLLIRQSAITETPRSVTNPLHWPSSLLLKPNAPPVTVELPRNYELEQAMTQSGMQLAGGAKMTHNRGLGLQLNEYNRSYKLRPDGIFQLAGGSRSSFNPNVTQYLALQGQPSVPRSGGLGSIQFIQEFVPTVYFNPFSGRPDTYPDEFIYNYDLATDSVDGY